MFLIRCNFNNVYTSTQSFFEFQNGQLAARFLWWAHLLLPSSCPVALVIVFTFGDTYFSACAIALFSCKTCY